MKGYLVLVARDATHDPAGQRLLAAVREAVTASRLGVLVLVETLATVPSPAAVPGAPPAAGPPALSVVGSPPPYDGRALRSLLLAAPPDDEALALLTGWLRDEDADLVDLPLGLSGSLLQVAPVAPRTFAPAPTRTGRRRPSR